METMKRQIILMPFVVAMAFLLISVVSAADLATSVSTEFNSVVLSSTSDVVSFTGNTIPVRVTFVAGTDADDVRVKILLDGMREDVSDSSERFNILSGKVYTKLLNLELPSSINTRTDELTLYVQIVNKQDKTETSYPVTIQRRSYELTVLSVDHNSVVMPGEKFAISAVIKNTGYNRNDDNYIVASIPGLGISSRGYAGDLIAFEDYDDYDDEEDSVNKVVYLQIPSDAPAGIYELVIHAYNYDGDSTTQVKKLIKVEESRESTSMATKKTQDVNAGESAKYELIIVNSKNTAEIFTISTTSSSDLTLSVPSAVVVGPNSGETVTIDVSVPENTKQGTYTFSVNVNEKQHLFAVNVVDGAEDSTTLSPQIVGLTVVLVIVFIVLLIVLIILISRKDNTVEEVETSYY
jgi:hypothetical protein